VIADVGIANAGIANAAIANAANRCEQESYEGFP
jgi:hypothetical protein